MGLKLCSIAGAGLRLQGAEGRHREAVAGASYPWKMSTRMLTGTRVMAKAPATPGSAIAMSRRWIVTPGDAGECRAWIGHFCAVWAAVDCMML